MGLTPPAYDTPDLFGPLTGNPVIEDAVVNTLTAWLPTYLHLVERRLGLRKRTIQLPPTPESIRAVLDFDVWSEDECPCVFAIVNPTGGTERNGGGYGSWFEIQIAATIVDQPHVAHRMAGYYGMALAALVVQNGSLGDVATRTELAAAPVSEYPDPTKRVIVRSTIVFHSFVDGLTADLAGADVPTPPDSPHYPGTPDQPWTDWPTVTSTPVTLTSPA